MSKHSGGPTQGILKMLATRGLDGARAKEIYLCFPSTVSSSILTYMRRKGLIVKAGVVATAPYIITPAGTDLLNSLEDYTPAIYWQATWGIGKFNTFKHIGFKNLNESLFPWEQPNYAAQYHGRNNC